LAPWSKYGPNQLCGLFLAEMSTTALTRSQQIKTLTSSLALCLFQT